jgi:hypothetical protein
MSWLASPTIGMVESSRKHHSCKCQPKEGKIEEDKPKEKKGCCKIVRVNLDSGMSQVVLVSTRGFGNMV